PPPAPASQVAPVRTNTVDLKKKDHLYTNSPNERVTHRFPIGARELVEATSRGWPEIGAVGARTLVSQWWHETGAGKYCFNYNLGNVKAVSAQVLHMYLRGVWELVASEKADAVVQKANGMARLTTEEECKAHGWTHKATQSVVVFDPPHPAARFMAFDTLSDAVDFWLKKHHRIADKRDNYLPAIRSGDTSAVAHVLKSIGYYTGDEGAYARGMAAAKAKIDAAFGEA
ncbi:MAG: hypothetical protein M3O50_07535, partial [Myxococcota bacterium]|nr:hypothetical protein [Myxococcota bacterium]